MTMSQDKSGAPGPSGSSTLMTDGVMPALAPSPSSSSSSSARIEDEGHGAITGTQMGEGAMPPPMPLSAPVASGQTQMLNGDVSPPSPTPRGQASNTQMAEGAMPSPWQGPPTATLVPVDDDAVDDDEEEEGAERAGAVLGPYRLVSLLGSGGMGRVWRAEHMKLGRMVALKLLRRRYASQPAAVRRFFGEARAVNAIRHQHIIDVTDFLELPGGVAYVMELLDGQSLGQALRAAGTLPVARAVDIGAQVASAMAAVHHAGVVHRDLKPDNVFLTTKNGRADFVTLLDFGVARLAPREQAQKTSAGAVLGTPAYMAPEQLFGRAVDHRADIYALGVILFELVSGRRPRSGTGLADLVVQHSTQPPATLGVDVDRRLADLIAACLANDLDARPASMADVEVQLRALAPENAGVARGSIVVPPVGAISVGPITAGAARRSPPRVLVGAAVAVVVVVAVLAGLGTQDPATPASSSVASTAAAETAPAVTAPAVTAPAETAPAETANGETVPTEATTNAATTAAAPSVRKGAGSVRKSPTEPPETTAPAMPQATETAPETTPPATPAETAPPTNKTPGDTRAVTLDPFG